MFAVLPFTFALQFCSIFEASLEAQTKVSSRRFGTGMSTDRLGEAFHSQTSLILEWCGQYRGERTGIVGLEKRWVILARGASFRLRLFGLWLSELDGWWARRALKEGAIRDLQNSRATIVMTMIQAICADSCSIHE